MAASSRFLFFFLSPHSIFPAAATAIQVHGNAQPTDSGAVKLFWISLKTISIIYTYKAVHSKLIISVQGNSLKLGKYFIVLKYSEYVKKYSIAKIDFLYFQCMYP